MSLRIRATDGSIWCGAKSSPEPDDCYIDDGNHYRMSVLLGIFVPAVDENVTGRWYWLDEAPEDAIRTRAFLHPEISGHAALLKRQIKQLTVEVTA